MIRQLTAWIGILLLLLAVLGLSACIIRSSGPTVIDQPMVEAPAPTPLPPPPPQMKILKLSGTSEKNRFKAVLEWNGPNPESWKVPRWTLFHDTTGQTQSLLVLHEQVIEIRPGEPRTAFVQAMCINPELPAPRQLIVQYEGAPNYILTDQIPNPEVAQVIKAIQEVEQGMQDMMPRLSFTGEYLQRKNPQPKDQIYLDIVVWNLDSDPPYPYIETGVMEGAIITAVYQGRTLDQYAIYLQQMNPGLQKKEALTVAKTLRDRINRLLELAGVQGRVAAR